MLISTVTWSNIITQLDMEDCVTADAAMGERSLSKGKIGLSCLQAAGYSGYVK